MIEIKSISELKKEEIVRLIKKREINNFSNKSILNSLLELDPNYIDGFGLVKDRVLIGVSLVFNKTLKTKYNKFKSAYWANLFIDEDVKNPFLYLKLLNKTKSLIKSSKYDFIFAAVRRKNLAISHTKSGFKKFDERRVLFKPIQPLKFYLKKNSIKNLSFFILLDKLYSFFLKILNSQKLKIKNIFLDEKNIEELKPFIDAKIKKDHFYYDLSFLTKRLKTNINGEKYNLLSIESKNELFSGLIYSVRKYENDINLLTVMDIIFSNHREMKYILNELTQIALSKGVDGIIMMNQDFKISKLFFSNFFFTTNEKYELMTFSNSNESFSFKSLNFSFLDHDAF